MDLATLTAAPTTVTVGGRDYRIGPLRFLEYGIFQRHINERSVRPDPAPPGWKPPQVLDDSRWIPALMTSEDGVLVFLQVLFGKHQDLGDDDLSHLLAHVGPAHLDYLWKVALDAADEADPAPKADAAP